MKLITVGHPGSGKISIASRYLINKYTPFELTALTYMGEIHGWAEFVADYLRGLDDKHIVFALDDYLLASPLKQDKFDLLLENMDEDKVCGRLCDSSFYQHAVIEPNGLIRVDFDDYLCTTQYCIWNREALINILEQVHTPWEFELDGTEFMKRIQYSTLGTVVPALEYNTNSALSAKWEGIDFKGLNEEDLNKVKELCI